MTRNITLDAVRGLAILGILLLNITAFGLPKAAYLNPAWYGDITSRDAWTWALLDLFAQVKFLTLFALLFGAGLQMLLPRGKRWIQARLTLLALLGFLHAIFIWDGDILLAYGLVGLVCWRMVRDAPSVKSLFKTGVVLYLIGIAVLLLLGMMSGEHMSRSWTPQAADLFYEKFWRLEGGMEAVRSRLDLLSSMLLALGAQYGWQLAGMMLTGAALMRSGWLRGEFSLRHYRRTGFGLVALGVLINLPAIVVQWQLGWDYRWCAFSASGAARTGRAVAGARLYGAGFRLLAVSGAPETDDRRSLRRAHGAHQLSAAKPDLHDALQPLRPVYAV